MEKEVVSAEDIACEVLSEAAIFDTVKVLNEQAVSLVEGLEDSSIPDHAKNSCNDIKHIIWASMQITNDIVTKVRSICENEAYKTINFNNNF